LSIFGIKPYKNEETGTTVIIPYIDEEKILSNTINKDETEKKYWVNDLPTCLSMSLQRWYFARLNNQQYNGKYIIVAINNVKVELNKFYQKLQDLYNGNLDGATYYSVGGGKFNPTQILGTFKYKIFDKETYSAYNIDLINYINDNNITSIYLCGIDVECCVLITAINLFENNYNVYVLKDYSYCTNGIERKNNAIEILKRNIGKDRVI
jgi:hypothetical protein